MSTQLNSNPAGKSGNLTLTRLGVSIFLHSLSIIGFQIILIRILSVNQWDHFANMIISIAMLGFGVSGILLALTGKRLLKHSGWLIPLLMMLSSLLMLLAFRASQHDLLRFDTLLVFGSLPQMMRLVAFCVLFFLPFFAASLAIGMVYVRHVQGIGRLYFANLLGSGIGGVIAMMLLGFMMPGQALPVAALFPLVAAVIIMPAQRHRLVKGVLTAAVALAIFSITHPVPLALSQYKSLSLTRQLPDAEVTLTHSGVSSLVHIVESEYLRFAPGLSLHFTGQVPVKPMAFVNGNGAGHIPDPDNPDETKVLEYSGYLLPYLLAPFGTTAVVESGTGTQVAFALRNGAKRVHAFESRVTLLSALDRWHHDNTPSVYRQPGVVLHRSEARVWFNAGKESVDLIVLPSAGSFGGASGLQALHENFTLTLEATQAYWNQLNPTGAIHIMAYTDMPSRTPLKIVATLAQMLRNNGIEHPEKHIAAVRTWNTISFVVTKTPLDERQITTVRQFADEMGFDPFILPGITPEERNFFHETDDDTLFHITDRILAGDMEPVEQYLFCITPATDDKPYFSRFIRIGRLGDLTQEFRWSELPFVELGYVIVWITFAIALVLSVLLILIPVIGFGKRGGNVPILLYFGGIGLGFMFAEIILIQRFVLYLGQPVYAVSAVLSVMLVASGIGSMLSARFKPLTRHHGMVFALIFLLLLLYALFLTPFLRATAGVPVPLKVIITCLIVSIPALLMGMPFPLGLQSIGAVYPGKVAWAWGVNGFLSVIAAPLALILAVERGSTVVMLAAAMAYLISLIALLIIKHKKT